jgi:hypothetical protein
MIDAVAFTYTVAAPASMESAANMGRFHVRADRGQKFPLRPAAGVDAVAVGVMCDPRDAVGRADGRSYEDPMLF